MIREINTEYGFKIKMVEPLELTESSLMTLQTKVGQIIKYFPNSWRYHIDLLGRTLQISHIAEDNTVYLLSSYLSLELRLLKLTEDESIKKMLEHALSADKILLPSELSTKLHSLTDFSQDKIIELEKEVLKGVVKLSLKMQKYHRSYFERISDYFLTLTANYSLIRVNILKFLVILPWLDFDKKGRVVKRVLRENLRRLIEGSELAKLEKKKGVDRALPKSLLNSAKLGFWLLKFIPERLLAFMARGSVRFMAKRFIAGENIHKARTTLKKLAATNRSATLDQLGELVVSQDEADAYFLKVLDVIEGLKKHYPKGARNKAGILEAHVSIKVSALSHDFKPEAFDRTYELVYPRLKKILLAGMESQVFINIDAEHYHTRDLVFNIYKKILLETPELKNYQDTGIVVQAYLRDSIDHLKDVIKLADERKLIMPIRLVKGAYFDAETIEAQAHHFPAPQFLNKEETDLNFRQLTIEILHQKHLALALASHNLFDHLFCEYYRSQYVPNANLIEHQCLHMTYEALSETLAKQGYAVRNYMPIGNLIVGMAYLVRRIIENSSQVGILTIMRSHQKAYAFASTLDQLRVKIHERSLVFDSFYELSTDFHNVSPTRLYVKEHLDYALKLLNEYTETNYADGVGHKVYSPNNSNLLIGRIPFYQADNFKDVLTKFKNQNEHNWWHTDYKKRFVIILTFGQLLLRHRLELATLIVMEAGKTMPEALADVDEAIDFVHFYQTEGFEIFEKNKGTPKGITAVIAPWNFPLAIPCGMTIASLIAGNKVILKSSEKSPLVAEKMVSLLYQAGVPKDICLHAPGLGNEIGPIITSDPNIAMIVFTGSLAVGKKLFHEHYQSFFKYDNQKYPRKLIAEMGGKNAVIVSNTSDLDEAISNILYSTFAHAGQKCSACSRILVDHQIKDRFIERFTRAVADLAVGPATDLFNFINPVITQMDKERLIQIKKDCVKEVKEFKGKIHYLENDEVSEAFTVKPAIFELPTIRALDSDSLMHKEHFGPIVHITTFRSPREAVKIFNATNYALTGGVFSQSDDEIDFYLKYLHAGNLYINRSNTGARVGIEPFGGFKLSGTGPKAGGSHYVDAFTLKPDLFKQYESAILNDYGSDYLYQIPKTSKRNPSFRRDKVIDIINDLLIDPLYIFNELDTEFNAKLISLKKWFETKFEESYLLNQKNVTIPGQISVNRYDIPGGPVCFILENTKPSVSSIIHLLICLSLGDGIVLLCTNNQSYQIWHRIYKLIRGHGISNYNIDVYHVSKDVLDSALKDPEFEYYFFDTDLNNLEFFQKQIADNYPLAKYFPKLYHSYTDLNFSEILRSYALERSLAINIMKHGAPLN